MTTFAGHIFSAASQPFFMFIPTKVASIWFPENQRATANSIMSMCNPLGILAANIFSPLIVQQPSDILLMVVIYAIPAGIQSISRYKFPIYFLLLFIYC